MNLWFIGQNTRIIKKVRHEADHVLNHIKEFCDERNFKIYYVRTWTEGGATWYDVGSHTEFFVVADENWSPPA